MPMLMGTGGNAGSQASAMIIRGLAVKEVKFSDFWKVVWKEIRVSLLLGVILSIACFAKLMVIDALYTYDGGVTVALVVCLSLFATVLIAKMIGAMLPLLAQKCHLDPAVVASPFITTIVDVLSLTIYCAIAVAMLGGL
jgi:magnesium transporter